MPPFCEKHQCFYETDRIHKEICCEQCRIERNAPFSLLPKAIGTTEILNEVKADKGILTEEELNKISFNNEFSVMSTREIRKLIDSHRNLLSANAELSFKNQKSEKDFVNLANLIKEIIPFIHNIEVLDRFQTVLLEMFEKRAKEILK